MAYQIRGGASPAVAVPSVAKRILIDFGHGLGDVVQSTVVLKHLQVYRPDWEVHYRCGIGKHTAVRGLCARVFHDKEEYPKGPYDTKITPGWFENYCRYHGKPNSKITNCLTEVFGIPYDASLGRYQIAVGDEAKARTAAYLESIGAKRRSDGRFNVVVAHYEGNTSPHKKNLRHWQMQSLLELAILAGRIPVILDWDDRSKLPDNRRIFRPPTGPGDIWGGFGSGDAESIAALIGHAEAYLGIDSGPGKVASATDTPTLIHWTGHHPIQFHDPAPNTTHLLPAGHRHMPPLEGKQEPIAEYFEKAYLFRTYHGDPEQNHDLVSESRKWLGEVLGVKVEARSVEYVLPTGIGDTVWALHKIRAINEALYPGSPIDIILSGDPTNEIDRRTIPLLKRFGFVRKAYVADVPVLQSRANPTNEKGRYKYVPDGLRGTHHFLTPNHALERGVRLEDWLPEYPIDWDILKEFSLEGTEAGARRGDELGKFVAFYLGPERGNVDEGHNRGFLWEPKHWNALGKWFTKQGCRVAVVGAPYDRSYWERYVREGVGQEGMEWVDLIGAFPDVGDTYSFLLKAKCFISYQCGLGIISHYLGQNVAMWWRPDGDSSHSERMVSFDERMAHCWTNPKYRDRYLPLIYRRETVEDIIRAIDEKGWVK